MPRKRTDVSDSATPPLPIYLAFLFCVLPHPLLLNLLDILMVLLLLLIDSHA
jgi:hypothetical protein